MPTYEMPLLLRVMRKPDLTSALKRVATIIFEQGGVIKKIDNLGHQQLPYKTSIHNETFRESNVFILHFVVPPRSLQFIKEEYKRDIDIIRTRVFKQNEPMETECTIHEDKLPPYQRKTVQEMVKRAARLESRKPKFTYNSGLNYYPFQK